MRWTAVGWSASSARANETTSAETSLKRTAMSARDETPGKSSSVTTTCAGTSVRALAGATLLSETVGGAVNSNAEGNGRIYPKSPESPSPDRMSVGVRVRGDGDEGSVKEKRREDGERRSREVAFAKTPSPKESAALSGATAVAPAAAHVTRTATGTCPSVK